MTIPGPKPIPNEQKIKNGTFRADRHGKGELITITKPDEIPNPPASLGVNGCETWQRIYGFATWVHPETDRDALIILCQNIDERESLREAVNKDSENWRARVALREIEKSINSQLSAFGLNPADRARYGFAVVKTENELDRMLRRKAERDAQFKSQ